MRRINYIVLLLIIFLNIPFSLRAEVDYEPNELPILVGDFSLSYSLVNENGAAVQNTVNTIATIRILPEVEPNDETYILTLYLDRGYVLSKRQITLPYDFKWNFRGLSNGSHELYFILKDSSGKLGVLKVDITVQH